MLKKIQNNSFHKNKKRNEVNGKIKLLYSLLPINIRKAYQCFFIKIEYITKLKILRFLISLILYNQNTTLLGFV